MRYPNLIHTKFFHILLGWRGVFLAVFVAFLLTACGGGAGITPDITEDPPNTGVDCETNPFGKGCGVEFVTEKEEKISECLIGNMAGTPDCKPAVDEQSCIGDPFADGCDEDAEFSVFLEVAKTQREAFCTMDDNAKDTLCVGAVATLCGDNPFNDLCTADSYIRQQEDDIAECITDGNASEPDCANAVKFNPCIRNPFTPECSTQTVAQTARKTFCDKGNNAANALCAGAVAHFCADDPFDDLCDKTAYSRQQSERADFCISDANASNTALCMGAIAQDACISDPFTEACSTQEVARFIRESFCRKSTNAADNPALCGNAVMHFCTNNPLDGLCDQMTQEMQLCTNDPFNAACDPTTYEMQRATRTTECITGDNASDTALCANAILDDACIGNPYGTGCESKANARTARESYCRGNVNPTLCGQAITHFCTADPFDSICKASNFATFTRDREARVTACITGNKASDATLCKNAIANNACIRNPFTPECSTETVAQTARKIFCDEDNNAENALCKGAVVHFCAIDPFDDLCDNVAYSQQQDERAALCIKDDNASNDDLCKGAIDATDVDCITDPYIAGCESKLTARAARESYCRGNTNPTLCGNAVLHFCAINPLDGLCDPTALEMQLCTNDPFDAACDDNEYSSQQMDRAALCISEDNASDDALCANAILDDACIGDPYGAGCESKTDARTARESYCRGNDNSALCDNAVLHFCTADPFDGLCDAGTYSMQRGERVTACIAGNKASDDDLCKNAIADNACIGNPFTPECSTQTDARTKREEHCRDGFENDTLCAGAVVHFCTTDPFDSLCNMTNFASYTSARGVFESFCRAEQAGRADDPRCANAVLHFCADDPFDSLCSPTTYETQRNTRDTLCRASDNALGHANDPQCTGVLAHFCTDDPYDAVCNPVTYASARTMRVAECITGDNAKADNPRCTNAIADNSCIRNPFTPACNTEIVAQTARKTFCSQGNNATTNGLCNTAVVYFCDTDTRNDADPFDGLCDKDTYRTQRDTRTTECIMSNNARANNPRCTNAIADNACIRNPFTTKCSTQTDARDARETYCRGNNNPTLCTGAIVHVCDLDPFDDLCDDTDYSLAQSERAALCIKDDNASNDDLCKGAIADAVATDVDCITDPFTTACAGKATARIARETFCRAGNKGNDLCTGAVEYFCDSDLRSAADPFDVLCDATDHSSERIARVTTCITGDNASNDALCENAIKANPCIGDPYPDGTSCDGETRARNMREAHCRAGFESSTLCIGAVKHFCDSTARSEADPFDGLCNSITHQTQRDMRESDCRATDNALAQSNAAECRNLTVHFCAIDPYDGVCNATTYETERKERFDECIIGDKASADSRCTNALAGDACIRNPFATACSTQTRARTARETYCRASTNATDNPTLCADAVVHFCDTSPTSNPFDTDLCFADMTYGTARDVIIMDCIAEDATRLDNTDCTNAAKANPCIRNPFNTNCKDDFTTYYLSARTNREKFCKGQTDSTYDLTLCAGAIVHVCEADPFETLCNNNNDYSRQKRERVDFCIKDANASDTDLCAKAIGANAVNACISDPFTDACRTQKAFRSIRESFCREGTNAAANPTLCDNAVVYICDSTARAEADPFDRLCDAGTYSVQRGVRVTACITGDNASDVALCAKAIADDECILDPYAVGAGCESTDSNPTAAQTARTTFCRAGNEGSPLCASTVSHFCTDDPFDGLCDPDDYSLQRETRVTECIMNDNARADNSRCKNAIADNACIGDPYGAGCETETEARDMRKNHCDVVGNEDTPLCAGAVVHFCTIDPYDALCDDGDYSSQQMERTALCIKDANASDPDLCGGAIADAAVDCITDPFTAACVGADNARTARETYCRGNVNPTLCTGAIAHFCDTNTRTQADPFDGLCDEITHSGQRTTRVTACITGDKADDPTCANAVKFNACIRNPFTTECSGENDARNKRKEFCDETGNATKPLCAGAVVHFCAIDPYDDLCDDNDYARQQGERVDFCIRGDNASDELCAGAIDAAIDAGLNCITDPYAMGCESKLTARAARESYCRGNTNPTLCGNAVVYFCDSTARAEADPYDDLCNPGTYSVQRTARVTACITGDNASDDALCENAIDADKCILDPYAMGCESTDSNPTAAQAARTTFCRAGNEGNALCASTVEHVCDSTNRPTVDPFDTLCDPETYRKQQEKRLSDCEGGVVTDPPLNCTNAILEQGMVLTICTADPFDTRCSAGNFARFTTARSVLEGFCRAETTAVDDPLCANAVLHFCAEDPFDSLCNPTNYVSERGVRDTLCRATDNALGHANDPQCKGAIAHFCTADPFDTLCNTNNFVTFTADRGTRDTLCRANDNDLGHANAPQCMGAIAHFCTADPFDTLCNTTNFTNFTRDRSMRETDCRVTNDPTLCAGAVAHFCDSTARPEADPFDGLCDETLHSMQRATRTTECITGNNARVNSPDPRCTNAIADNACIRNPFTPECSAETEAQNARKIFCSEDDNSTTEGLCTEAVVYFCDSIARPEADPFDADLCLNDMTYNDAREKRTEFCLVPVNSTNPLCAGLVASDECFNNPFIRNLTTGLEACGVDFAPRREASIRRCIVGDEGNKPACISVLAGVGGCLANPFLSSCKTSLYFKDFVDDAKKARVKFCDMDDGTINDDDYCFGRTFVRDICIYDPFSSFCADESFNAADNTTLQSARTDKIIDCGGDDYEEPGSCAHVFDLVTAATWAHGDEEDEEDRRPFNTQPTAKDQFLRATSATGLDKTGATAEMKLDLATSTFDHNPFGGNAHNGVEFFQVPADNSGVRYYYYAGILGAANLGKPLSGKAQTMYWNGRISSTKSIGTTNSDGSPTSPTSPASGAGGAIVATDFTLTIVFNGSDGTLASFAKVFLDTPTDMYYYDIDGSFDENGLITGTVVYAEFTDGNDKSSKVANSIPAADLTGIIGKEGALGVFFHPSPDDAFSGGFVASGALLPRVESSDWVRGFATPLREDPTEENQFLQQAKNFLRTTGTTITAGGSDYTTGVETLELKTSSSSFVNDVSWFSGFIGNIQYHYAGLSASANLGEPLNEAPVSSTWYGQFGVGASRTDFALDIAFATGKISAFVRESAGVYYLLEGNFNRVGVITNGTVNYGVFINGDRTDADAITRGTNGVLTGLIGQDGALGVFISTATGADGYSGGFYASESGADFGAIVDYNTWSRNFLSLADNPDTATPQNQFLGGTADGISTAITQAGGTVLTARTLDLTTMNLDGDALGGVNTNRVDWFSGDISGTQYYYAGIFGDANLGAPLTETPRDANWRGIIGVGGTQTDFTLTVTYGTTVGDRIGTVGTISAFVRDTPNVYYRLEGGFDASGLIVGTVKYGEFTDRDTPVGTTEDGVLDGLIGRDGALGVFYSTTTGGTGYSGGFVARENAPTYAEAIKYSDYQRSFLTLGLPDTTSPKNQFVTDATGVMTESSGGTDAPRNSLALDTNTFDGRPLGGTPDNSLFWFDGFAGSSSTRTYYAGLNDRTDLGLPIVASGNWRGVFGLGSAKTDFTLNITYGTGGGTIAAFIHELEDSYYLLAGDFDASGLITGTVKYGKFTDRDTPVGTTEDGILTGLIGSQGAIGAFYSTATGPTGYSGGFVARDYVADFAPLTVGYNTWSRSFLLADTPDESKPGNQFLRAKTATLDTTGVTDSTTINLDTATFNSDAINGDENDRYQFFNNIVGGEQRNYVGILPSTDLGAFVAQDNSTSAIWYGSFRGVNAGIAHTTDFVLHLTLDGTTGTLSARANYRNTDYYTLEGRFDANGLITGTVAYNTNTNADTPLGGILTGLIGSSGAIGVFIGGKGINYGGGFVAAPKTLTFTDSIKYSDWIARANPDELPSARNQFLQTTNKTISTGTATVSESYSLSLNSTTFDGARILGDINNGLAYFTGTIGATAYAYAGIYDSTDLGAPLTQNATWNGVVGFNGVEKPANFTITFNSVSGGGTITTFITDIIATEDTLDKNDFLIAGTFDDLGLITGTVNYAEYTGDLVGGAILNTAQAGVLSGLIGAEGAVGVFHSTITGADAYSGGFITSADVKEQVNIDKWRDSFKNRTKDGLFTVLLTRSPESAPTPEDPARQNQFLFDKPTNFADDIFTNPTTSIRNPEITTLGLGSKLGLAEATYKGISLGGDNTGGISYFQGFQSGDSNRLWYAYLNNDSKLGTRIADTMGEAEYHGQFRAWAGVFATTDSDFTLTVNFENGSILSSFAKESRDTGRFYQVSGTYSAAGVITGKVEYGSFTAGTFTAASVGFVSGLISHDNALGVFIGTQTPDADDDIPRPIRGLVTTGLRNDGFVGGFVARRFVADDNDANVRYTDWAEWFIPRIKADTITPKSQFLTTVNGVISTIGTNTPTDITTATLNDIYYKPVTIPGDARDGFSYFTADGYGYAGILDSTNLGAPVRASDVTADWHGQLNFNTIAPREFTIALTYDTDGGTIAGFLSDIVGQTDFALNGDFNEYGVITGRTNFAQYMDDVVDGRILNTSTAQAGVLSGLIGREGAVAVFHGLEQNTYVGGFVVHPLGADGEDVSYSDWIREKTLRGKTYKIIAEENDSSQFLQTEDRTINTELVDSDGMTVTPEFETPATYLHLNNVTFDGKAFNGDGNDGLGYFVVNNAPTVGILDTTNLGAPLTQTQGDADALWSGQLNFITRTGDTSDTYAAESINRDFILTIKFNNTGGTIEGNVEELTVDEFTGTFFINGAFDSQGLINSRTSTTYFDTVNNDSGTLSGIIGQEGAVGVFVSNSRYAGGFVAHPKVVGRVSYSDWVTANPFPILRFEAGPKKDDRIPIEDYPHQERVSFEGGIYDSPLRGNHFLSTTNDVISVGTDSANDYLITDRIKRPGQGNIFARNAIIVLDLIPSYVRFETSSHNIESLRASDATGGFAYFTGNYTVVSSSGSIKHASTHRTYVGILDSTDLGPALTQTAGTAQWKGQISFSNYEPTVSQNTGGVYSQNNDFTLNIEFTTTGGKVWGFAKNINSSVPDPGTGRDLYLEGTFDENGAISGKTVRKDYKDDIYPENDLQNTISHFETNFPDSPSRHGESLGVLSGLIGSHGAVGVFHQTNGTEDHGGGGFIVAPSDNVPPRTILEDYAAWQGSFDSAPATIITSAQNRFLSGSDDTVFANLRTEPLGAGTTAPVTNLNLNTTLYDGNALAGHAGNSVSFANGYFDSTTTTRSFYALINADANLGATLPVWATGDTATATWKGVFAAKVGNGTQTNTDFDLTVDFKNRQIQAEVPIINNIQLVYRLHGFFPVDLDGAIIGTVIRTDTVSGIDLQSSIPEDPYPPAVLTGLIGQDGAIGVFVSGSRANNGSILTDGTGDTGYSGGFVACDYDNTRNQCK